MKRVATAALLIPIVLIILFRAPAGAYRVAIYIVLVLALYEFLKIVVSHGYQPFWVALYVLSVPFVLGKPEAMVSLLIPVVGIATLVRGANKGTFPALGMSLFAIPYLFFSLWTLIPLRSGTPLTILFLLLVIWSGDVAAYYVGKRIGRHKLAPNISPGKSWEGTVASIIASITVGLLLVHFSDPISESLVRLRLLDPSQVYLDRFRQHHGLGAVAFASAWINVFAQMGDLFESLLKRGAGVKDSGTLLPGHGGVLDRIDALLFAAPAFYCLSAVLY